MSNLDTYSKMILSPESNGIPLSDIIDYLMYNNLVIEKSSIDSQ